MNLDDKYTYPDSGGVLRNHFGIRDPQRLDEALNDFATTGAYEMLRRGIPARPDFEYLRTIHRVLFSDVLPFAGQIRDVDAQAVGIGLPYCRPEFIRPQLDQLFSRLESEDYLCGLGHGAFARGLAERWGDLTSIHPFRDGNTRAQTIFIDALSIRAGHQLQWHDVDVEQLRIVRLHAAAGDSGPLAGWLGEHIEPLGSGGDRHEASGLSRLTFRSSPSSRHDPRTG